MAENKTKTKLTLIIPLILSAMVTGTLVGAFFAFSRDLPQIEALKSFKPSAVSRVYSQDDVLLAEFYAEKRDPVPLARIPKDLKTALLEIEDRKFYSHSGVDIRGIVRAIVRDIMAGDFVEGASTLTQQLAKTLFLTSKKTLFRKIQEAVLSFQLERRYTKDEILEFYLNQVYFGSGAYGVESAATIFFGKSVSELSLAECALIAAMPRSPSRYSPLVNPDLAMVRRNIVLKVLWARGHISEAVYKAASAEALTMDKGIRRMGRAPYFVEYIKKELETLVGSSRLYKSGLTIHATVNAELQEAAEASLNKHLDALEKRMVANGTGDQAPQGAVVSMDVNTGGVLVMVGGKNYEKSPFNRATLARRQPGSAFKPFVYACAVEKGFPQNMMILDAPVSFDGSRGDSPWEPENYSKSFLGEMTLRKALALSKNIPSIRLIETLGPLSVMELAHRMGIESRLAPNLSLALGTSETTLFELTSAYSVFPARGQKINPYTIESIVDRNGRVIFKAEMRKQPVMSPQNAAIVTNMLEGVVREGTARAARVLDRPLAGKTGTTDHCKDALFVGFSPFVVTGVWVGRDDNSSLGPKETGAMAALPIWIDVMERSMKNRPNAYFDIPDGTVQASMDPETGQWMSSDNPKAVRVLFKEGQEPLEEGL
ncbi:MAG: PBP1A family penicillin-binding protein [Proteobacteria bacterium]|nr:PBP1A family penicillin-binding protein [Pseudomonadota bacterium]